MKKNNIKVYKKNYNTGFSLLEILIAITIFSIVGLLSTRAILLTMRGTKKSDSQVRVRENINYALSIIERQVRNSENVTCPNSDSKTLNFISYEGVPSILKCYTTGTDTYIELTATDSARLTSGDVKITACSIVCTKSNSNSPPTVKLSIEAEDLTNTSTEKGSITTETEIVTRNY